MDKYKWELWLGRATNYWQWDIKGVLADDYTGKVKCIDEATQELKFMKDYYNSLLRKVNNGD